MSEVDLLGQPLMRRSAWFVTPGVRIRLSRDWSPGPRALVIGCNPSTADGQSDDPTTRWWNEWFRWFGFGGYDAMNLYPFCTSSPIECRRIAAWEDNGPDWHARDAMLFTNLPAIVEAAKSAQQVFVCWGAIAWDCDWIEHVVEEIQSGIGPFPDLWCWGLNKDGSPKHPKARGVHRISPSQMPILWRPV